MHLENPTQPTKRPTRRRILVGLVSLAGVLFAMTFIDAFTKNWADLEVHPRDPTLKAIVWPLPPDRAIEKASGIIRGLTRWDVVASDPNAGTLHATHKTRAWRFVDDVTLRFEAVPEGTRITGHSQSRIGKADFGQNARNLRELVAAFR